MRALAAAGALARALAFMPTLALALALWAGAASVAAHAADNSERKSSAEARQSELRTRIRALKDELARNESKRSEARDALDASETAISDANRKLRDLGRQQREAQTRLAAALGARARTEADIAAQRAHLGELVRAQYLANRQSPWQLLLSGENPNAVGRNLAYLGYFARARQDAVAQLEQSTQQLAAVADEQRARADELGQIAAAQQTERQTLEKQKKDRTATLQKISDQVRAQRKEVGALERDAARLDGLIGRLSKLIAEEEKRARDRREAARRAAEQAARKPPETRRDERAPSRPDTSPPPDDAADDAPWIDNGTPFASTRGKLHLPVRGELLGRFGQARADSKMTWKGVFIGAAPGTEVKAIAAGRVVFADWLRGFGNLLIVDHGAQYLSIYGGNEAMYKQAGQAVRAGEPIATVGATGGADRPGLYFEMRHRGEPFDPLGWVR